MKRCLSEFLFEQPLPCPSQKNQLGMFYHFGTTEGDEGHVSSKGHEIYIMYMLTNRTEEITSIEKKNCFE